MNQRRESWLPERPWLVNVTNVSELTGGPLAPGQGGAHAYSVESSPFGVEGLVLYVTYLALPPDPSAPNASGEVHQLQYAFALGVWRDLNLSAQTAGSPPVEAHCPVAYLFRAQGTSHIFYLGSDGPLSSTPNLHIDELWDDQNGWHHNNLTLVIGAPLPSAASPCAYTVEFEQTQHVLYIGEDGHLHELWWGSGDWHWNDLTNTTGAPIAVLGTSAAGFVSETSRTQHVHFVGQDGQIHGVRWKAGSWARHDAEIAGGIPGAAPASPAGYFSDDSIERLVYIGVDNHVHELSCDGTAWQHEDPSQDTNVLVEGDAALAACSGLEPGTRRIVVIPGGGGSLQEFSTFGTGWNHRVLLDSLGANADATPDAGARPGAFTATAVRQEYVFFPSINFRITAVAGPYIPVAMQ